MHPSAVALNTAAGNIRIKELPAIWCSESGFGSIAQVAQPGFTVNRWKPLKLSEVCVWKDQEIRKMQVTVGYPLVIYHSYGQPLFFYGKIHYFYGHGFNSYVNHYQRVIYFQSLRLQSSPIWCSGKHFLSSPWSKISIVHVSKWSCRKTTRL